MIRFLLGHVASCTVSCKKVIACDCWDDFHRYSSQKMVHTLSFVLHLVGSEEIGS